ncbi:TPA: recombinase family protein, partial [Escherichia coli]|nr:recombinase family protein [Escherichia coli]
MTGQRIGYIRVSTFDQNPERQLEGVKVDRAFSDKASGKDVKRPQRHCCKVSDEAAFCL